MENESTSTWAFLNKSGEIESIESDPGSSSESSIEFIHDDIVHYERNNNQQSSLQPEVQEASQDVSENSSEIWSFHDTIFDGTTVADHGSAVKDEEDGERSRRDLTLENITSVNSNASVSPYSKSPVSPSSSDDSSGSVTLLEGRFSDGDLDTFPEDFWFDSDFELLDQHSSSDLAHLQLATGSNNALPANQRPKINFKYKKQALSKSMTESANANDADDESSNNVEQCSSAEESEIALAAPGDTIPPVTNLGSLAPVSSHLLVPNLVLKPPRMSVTFMMLASLVVGLLLGFTTKYSLGPYSSEQLSEDIAEMQRINEMHLLIEENEHMHKYVDSLKWRMNNLQNSKKQQLSNELRQVNQLLKNRLDELDQQLLAVRNEIFETKSGVQPPVVSDSSNQDLPADVPQDLNEPASDSDPESQKEISSSVGAAFHDDIIQIQSSSEENVDVSFNGGSTDQMSNSGVSLVDIHQNDASVSSDEIIKSENKADDAITVLQKKLEEEKTRADNLEKLYAEMKHLVDSLKSATDSTALLAGASTVEIVQEEKDKKAKESTSYCSLLDKDCSASMDWLNRDAMLLLITSVISEIPPQAQQWKEYMVKKFQSMIDSQDQEEPEEEVKVSSETTSDFQFNKLNVYMNRMLNQITRAKEDLQNKFEKTLHKIKKGTSKFWEKTVSKSEKEIKSRKSKEKKKGRELVDNEAKHTSSQDSSLQVTEAKYMDSVDVEKEYNKINRKTEEYGQLQKGLEVVEIEQNKHKFDKKSKSIRSNKDKRHQHNESVDNKKHVSHKFDHKKKKQQQLHSNNEDKHGHNMKHWPQKSNYKGKKYQPNNLDNEEKHHRHRSNDDKERRLDKEEKKHRHRSNDDKEHRLDKEEKKHRHRSNDDKEHRLDKEEEKHRHKSNKEHQSDREEKKHRRRSNDDKEHGLDRKQKKHRHRSNNDEEHRSDKEEEKHRHKSNDKEHRSDREEKKHRRRSNDDKEHQSDREERKLHDDDIKHWSHKSDGGEKKYRLHNSDVNHKKYQAHNMDDDDTERQNQTYKSAKNKKHWHHMSGDKKKHFRNHKFQNNGKRIIDKNVFNAKPAFHERKNKVNEDSDKKSMKEQKNFKKKFNRSKNKLEMKAQSKDSCDQLAVRLQDSISTITKKKFRHMNSHTILRMSKKLSSFNKQCKPFSSNSVKVWAACQQMWWILCGQGFLPGQLQNFKCQHYLLAWQMSVAASPDGGGKLGCDECGCQNKAVNQKGLNKDDRQNARDSDSAFGNVEEEEKEGMSGEWYFKHKSVAAENKEKDCDENEFECMAADLLNEMETDSLAYLDQMLNAESHRMNHYSHVHRRRCRDYSNNVNCYGSFHPAHKSKWFSVMYQNFMNFIQNWQK